MFIGHYAVGFATKVAAPRASLGTHFAAVQLLDLIWPPLVLLGVEQVRIAPGDTAFTPLEFLHYPWSHSLLMAALWALGFAGVYYWRRRDAATAAWLGAAVFSHWVLDWVSHRPDLPLAPGMAGRYGLGLWNSVAATILVEVIALGAAAYWYHRSARPLDSKGDYGLRGLVALLLLIYAANTQSVPPNVTTVAIGGLGLGLFVWAGWWVDRHRAARA